MMRRDRRRRRFEVDAALRPEGKAGALVRTVESHARLLRGEVGQDLGVPGAAQGAPGGGRRRARGRQYAEVVAPLVWPAADRDNFVVEVQQMRRRVEDTCRPSTPNAS